MRLIIFILLCKFTLGIYAQNDFLIVKERVVQEILKSPVNEKKIDFLIKTFKDDGTWPHINYDDVSRTGFEHRFHARNILELSLAYSKKSSRYYNDEEVLHIISSALQHWCDNDYICDNWWYNQLGIPRTMANIFLLMDDKIDPELKEKAMPIIQRSNLNAAGARPGGDRIKIGGIAAKKGLVEGDEEKFAEIMLVINNEIKFSTLVRGIQHDYSFHHRVHRVNNTVTYGTGYADAFAEWAYYVSGTKYAFAEKQINMLVDYYLDGICKQNVYGIYNNEKGVSNREITRKERFRPASTKSSERLLMATNYRSNELEEIIALRRGEKEPDASFTRFFWQTEHFVCQRPEFYTSVRMFSTRNKNMEQAYNGEGIMNHYRADGSNFHVRRGDEYTNIWPVYDWQKIPGATILQSAEMPHENEVQKEGLTSFVGAVSDGEFAASCFDFISPYDGTKARKSWFFFDDEYVCLGAGIESYANFPIVTTLNQCLLNGDVTISSNGEITQLDSGAHSLQNAQWVQHDGFAYLFPNPQQVHLSNQTESGYWSEINQQSHVSKELVEKGVFKLWVDHGEKPQGRDGGFTLKNQMEKDVTYSYMVVPCDNYDELNENRNIDILANSRDVQAVRNNDLGIVQCVFYKADSLEILEGETLTVHSPMAIMLHIEGGNIKKITASDPSRNQSHLHFSISGEIELKDGGSVHFNSERNETEFSIALPQGVFAGKSTVVTLQ